MFELLLAAQVDTIAPKFDDCVSRQLDFETSCCYRCRGALFLLGVGFSGFGRAVARRMLDELLRPGGALLLYTAPRLCEGPGPERQGHHRPGEPGLDLSQRLHEFQVDVPRLVC